MGHGGAEVFRILKFEPGPFELVEIILESAEIAVNKERRAGII